MKACQYLNLYYVCIYPAGSSRDDPSSQVWGHSFAGGRSHRCFTLEFSTLNIVVGPIFAQVLSCIAAYIKTSTRSTCTWRFYVASANNLVWYTLCYCRKLFIVYITLTKPTSISRSTGMFQSPTLALEFSLIHRKALSQNRLSSAVPCLITINSLPMI